MLQQILKEREYLPILQKNDGTPVTRETWQERREEMRALLEEYSYGKTPSIPVRVSATPISSDHRYCAGKVSDEVVEITFETALGKTAFPIEIFVPHTEKKPPVFLHLAFGRVPNKYIPVEEITDAGYALVVVDYQDMMNDNHFGDFEGGIAAHFGTTAARGATEWGKIGMWAYGASRVMDYLVAERTDIDTDKVALIGHSRLGKTALWCGAQDSRFAAVISNNSGYGGAASSKHGTGERITSFLRVGSFDWFCENFQQFAGEREDHKPYDQSFLLSLIAPRLLCVGSAELDHGADPTAEFLTTLHASAAWELLGERGLVTPDRMPIPGDLFTAGNVCYHYRKHHHYLSREDWAAYITFLDLKWRS